jgi:hypothetical protein
MRRRHLHAYAIVLHRDAALASVAYILETNLDGATAITKGIFERVGNKLFESS